MTVRGSLIAVVLACALPTAVACGSEGRAPVAAAAAPLPATDAVDPAIPETAAPETTAPETSRATTVASTTSAPMTVVPTSSVPMTVVPTTSAPTTTLDQISPYLSAFCPTTPHAVTVDRDRQRAWLCDEGRAVYEFAFTGAITQPDPGTYPVYAKDLDAFSTLSRRTSFMTHFVAFTYGKYQGARVAFHSMPTYRDGEYVQPLESLGDPSMRGQSAGCLRVSPEDAARVWDWLAIGDEVRVIN